MAGFSRLTTTIKGEENSMKKFAVILFAVAVAGAAFADDNKYPELNPGGSKHGAHVNNEAGGPAY